MITITMITIKWIDLASWIFFVITVVLYCLERKKNKTYYRALQGIFKSLQQKAGFYAKKTSELKIRNGKVVPKEEYSLLVESVYTDYQSFKEILMGVIKAIEPGKDMPSDTNKFEKKN